MTKEPIDTSLTVQFHYLKTAGYREVACHGVIGGPSPQGGLWTAIYAERPPLPRMIEHEAAAEAPGLVRVDERTVPKRIEAKEGIIRVVEVGVHMDIAAAQRPRDWLNERIGQLGAQQP